MKTIAERLLIIVAAALVLTGCSGNKKNNAPPASTARPQEQKAETYIPQDLDDCFVQLEKMLKPADIETMRGRSERGMIDYHFGLGMWMRNNWGLWGDSRLAQWFHDRGVHHPDDMSGIILTSFWRHLHDQPIELDEQVKYYQDYWQKEVEQEKTRFQGQNSPDKK